MAAAAACPRGCPPQDSRDCCASGRPTWTPRTPTCTASAVGPNPAIPQSDRLIPTDSFCKRTVGVSTVFESVLRNLKCEKIVYQGFIYLPHPLCKVGFLKQWLPANAILEDARRLRALHGGFPGLLLVLQYPVDKYEEGLFGLR